MSAKLQEVIVKFDDRFQGVGTLKDKHGRIKYVRIQVDPSVKPVAQPYRSPPIHLEHKLIKELDKWEDKHATEIEPINERIPENEPTT